jgi:hypothetical protein
MAKPWYTKAWNSMAKTGFGKAVGTGYEGAAMATGKTYGGAKTVMGVAAVLAGIAAASTYLGMNPTGKRFEEDDRQVAQIPPLLTPQDLMAAAPTMAEMSGPADGRGEYEFRNRVRPEQAAREMANAQQPRMSAISPETVAELGAAANKPPELG